MNLKGRRALITGASGGIGKQIAYSIAEAGGDLFLLDMPNAEYDQDFYKLKDLFDIKVDFFQCDLESEIQRKLTINSLNKRADNIDILINNAAFVGETKLDGWVVEFKDQSIDVWRRALEVNLTAIFHLTQGLVEKLSQSGSGSIINIASIYGSVGPDHSLYEGTTMGNPAGYAASKGGLIQLTRWLSTTLAPDIRVNSISPGGVYRSQSDKFVKKYIQKTPLKRMATEEDLKGGIIYLASDLSSYVTGQNIFIDGGWTAW